MPPIKEKLNVADMFSAQSDSQEKFEEDEQTEEEKRAVRNKIKSIYQKLLDGKERFTTTDETNEFKNILMEAKNVVHMVKGTQEAIEDAKMFRLLCRTVKEMSEVTNINEQKFHELAQNLSRKFNFSTDNEGSVFVTRLQIVSFGKEISQYFSKAPTLKFVLGAVDTEEGEMRKKPAPPRKVVIKKEAATKIETKDKTEGNEQKTFKLVKSTKDILENVYKSNDKKPVDYFIFVIDPDSMFHVSFAVKERSVKLDIDENRGLPTLEPMKPGRGGSDDPSTKEQALISICMEDWRQLKEALNITQPMIVHPENLRTVGENTKKVLPTN